MYDCRFKGSKERGDMVVEYMCDHRINVEQQLTGGNKELITDIV